MQKTRTDDAPVVTLLVAGDRSAFERLNYKHNASLIRVATGIVRSRATAEEVAQDTWISVLRNIGDFEGRSSLAGWIYSILINKSRTYAKRDGRAVSFDDDGKDGGICRDGVVRPLHDRHAGLGRRFCVALPPGPW